jgi:hypothetical protein
MHTSGSMAKKFSFYIITGVLKEKILFCCGRFKPSSMEFLKKQGIIKNCDTRFFSP